MSLSFYQLIASRYHWWFSCYWRIRPTLLKLLDTFPLLETVFNSLIIVISLLLIIRFPFVVCVLQKLLSSSAIDSTKRLIKTTLDKHINHATVTKANRKMQIGPALIYKTLISVISLQSLTIRVHILSFVNQFLDHIRFAGSTCHWEPIRVAWIACWGLEASYQFLSLSLSIDNSHDKPNIYPA